MTVDELRIRLTQLKKEYTASRKIVKQIDKDIDNLDGIMARNFDAYWSANELYYEQ